MGFENSFKIQKIVPSLNVELLNYFKNIPNTEVLSVEEKGQCYTILLRFLDKKTTENRPEDILISISADLIYLCLYSGNRKVREEIFNGISGILKRLSIPFEEEEE